MRRLNWQRKATQEVVQLLSRGSSPLLVYLLLVYPITSWSVLTSFIIYPCLDCWLKKKSKQFNAFLENCKETKSSFPKLIKGDQIKLFSCRHTSNTFGINSAGLCPKAGVNPAVRFATGSRPMLTFWCPKKQLSHPPMIITIALWELWTIIPAQSLASNQRRPLAFLAKARTQTAAFLRRAGANMWERQKLNKQQWDSGSRTQ